MPDKEQDILKRLQATFRIEAEEHLRMISLQLRELKSNPDEEKAAVSVEIAFREAHSLKGAARSVNSTEIESGSRSLEDVFAALKRKQIVPSQNLLNLMLKVVNLLATSLFSGESQRVQNREELTRLTRELIQSAALLSEQPGEEGRRQSQVAMETPSYRESLEGPVSSMVAWSPDFETGGTVRIRASKLDALMLQAEEMRPSQLAFMQRTAEFRDLMRDLRSWNEESMKFQTIHAAGDHSKPVMNPLHNGADFLQRNLSRLKTLETRMARVAAALQQDCHTFRKSVDGLLTDVKETLMMPFSALLEALPGYVQKLAEDQGKQVDLVIRGGDLRVERRILQEMKDPFFHLMRNCVDHGVETPEERTRGGKPVRGRLEISLYQRNGKAEIVISDDGRGIDVGKVRAAAIKGGWITKEEQDKLNEKEVLPFIFRSGLSTSPIVTDLSGRGLGLAILKEKVVQKLGGTVFVKSSSREGTAFQILLPLTLASFRGIFIRAGDRLFAVPTLNVERVLRVHPDSVKRVKNKETITVEGRTTLLLRLEDVLGLPAQSRREKSTGREFPVVIAGSEERQIALSVDEILNEAEIVLKPLGGPIRRLRNISSATILGSGVVVPVINIHDLLKSAARSGKPATAADRDEADIQSKSVLVVEDSITARTLLKNILESAGYDVTTAVDGLDAVARLTETQFDLVVSDVDMPGMNGFDLTSKIRGDRELSHLPVILVTALDSRQDRERGIDVGANAYIVKSQFDQSNLLEIIRRFI